MGCFEISIRPRVSVRGISQPTFADFHRNSLISSSSKHSGAIKALQFNPHRDDLLASAGVKGELYITNLGGSIEPFRLGTSAARADDFDALDWNKKVPHILVTGSNGGFATVWDVRAKKESINLNNYGRKPISAIAWDPTTPTKVATATSYDQEPVVLMWDLRNSNAPEKILKQHDQGVLSLSWSISDPRLLLSCGKDNRTVCWNTQTGEAFGEFPIVTNWTFQTTWNPRHPGLLATASFDGKISVQTIQNTNPDTAASATAGQALDGADFFASAQSRPQGASFSLPLAPNWLQRPVGATFGFGGKLVHVGPADESGKNSKVSITSFHSDPAVGEASEKFEQTIQNGDLKSFCDEKISESKTEQEKADWTVIETLISKSRDNLKQYLGFAPEESHTNGELKSQDMSVKAGADFDDSSFFDNADGSDNFLSQLSASKGAKNNNPFKVYAGNESESDKAITRALILGDFEKALDVCLKEKRLSDALMIAISGGDKCIEKAKAAYFKQTSDGPSYLRLLASFSSKNLWDMVYNIDLGEWKDAIAAICTYAAEGDFSDLCEALGDRLDESSSSKESRQDASFCYLAGSKLEKVVNIWLQELQESEKASIQEGDEHASFFSIHATSLQEFIEKVTIFRQVTGFKDSDHSRADDWKLAALYAKYAEYADILASQGHLKSAERYLDLLPAQYPTAEVARNRVKQATRKQDATTGRAAVTTTSRGQKVISNFQPAQPPIVPTHTAASNAYAPLSAAAPAQPSNFIPAAAASRTAYAPAGYQPPQQNFGQPSGYPVSQQYGQAGYGSFGATPPPPRVSSQSPAIPPPSQNLSNIPQWNDTPDFFGSVKPAPRRAAPNVQGPISSPFANQPPAITPQGNAYGAPPKSSTPVPPPPKAGAPRVASPSTYAPAITPAERPSSVANSYAPPAGIPAPSQFQNIPRGGSPYNPPPSAGPPTGRYAPSPNAQPTAPPAQGGPPRPVVAQYAPPRVSSYASAPPPPQTAAAAPPPPPPKGAPPKGTASRIVVPPPSGNARNTLPSPQPSDSRPGTPALQAVAPSAPKHREYIDKQ
jgi:protein transport protein SEC31